MKKDKDPSDWILIIGNLINTTRGDGGLEFFGPCTEAEVQRAYQRTGPAPYKLKLQLLRMPKRWKEI